MFANTLTLTLDGTSYTLTRVNQDNYGSEYRAKNSTDMVSMKIRHTVDNQGGRRFNRHNVYVEWLTYATPSAIERMYTLTYTVRDLEGSDPAALEDLSNGVNSLLATLISGISIGEN